MSLGTRPRRSSRRLAASTTQSNASQHTMENPPPLSPEPPSPCIHRCSFAALSKISESHMNSPPDTEHPTPSQSHTCEPDVTGPVYHVPQFPVPIQGPIFPGEYLRVRLSFVSAMYLFAELMEDSGLRVDLHPSHIHGWPQSPTHLLRRTVAIASASAANFGALASFRECRLSDFAPSLSLVLIVVARYRLHAPARYHRPYPCILVTLVCDMPPLHFPQHLRAAKQSVACGVCELDKSRLDTSRRTVNQPEFTLSQVAIPSLARTRSQTAAVKSAAAALSVFKNHLPKSDFPDCVTHQLDPLKAIDRANQAAIAAASCNPPIVDLLLLHQPPTLPCPSQWSFWLCAALPIDVHNSTLVALLAETSAMARLARLVQLLRSLMAAQDMTSSFTTLTRFRKRRKLLFPVSDPVPDDGNRNHNDAHADVAENENEILPDVVSTKHRAERNARTQKLLVDNPWPSSLNAFDRVNMRYPCLGHFALLKPASKPD